jgi:hypothetical protein
MGKQENNDTDSKNVCSKYPSALPRRGLNYELRITNYELRITNYELRITNYELRITNYELKKVTPKIRVTVNFYQMPTMDVAVKFTS